jgi:hypothetical protein
MNDNEHNDIVDFANWFLAQPLFLVAQPPGDALAELGEDVDRYILYRKDRFQVELLLVKPGPKEFPEHIHPDIDTIQVHLAGDFEFTKDRKPYSYCALPEPEKRLTPLDHFRHLRIRDGETHGAVVQGGGGAFLSVQHWLRGTDPSSVVLNWEGPAYSGSHAELLKHHYEYIPSRQ